MRNWATKAMQWAADGIAVGALGELHRAAAGTMLYYIEVQ